MNALIATKDAVFARMLTLEFEDKNITVLSAETAEEIQKALSRAHMALIDAAFLKENTLPQFPYDIIIFGFPEDFEGISTQELTKYYTLTRPFLIDDFFASLFVSNEESNIHLRVPKRKSPAESLALDAANHLAYYKGEKIVLTQKEFALFKPCEGLVFVKGRDLVGGGRRVVPGVDRHDPFTGVREAREDLVFHCV